MFENNLPRVKAPEGPRGANQAHARNAPQKNKKHYYVFKNVDDPDIREIVQSVANGLDASLISPELYPLILGSLQSQEIYLKKSNPCASQSLHDAIQYINNWKPEEPVVQKEPREDIFLPSQEMIDKGIDYAMNGKDLFEIDPMLLQFLIAPLREIRLKSLKDGDYITAQKAEQGARAVVAQQNLQEKMDEQDEKISEQQQRLEIAQIQLENVKEKWEILMERRKQEMENDIQNKKMKFAMKLEEFDQQFEQEPPPKALKLSPGALDLKAKEKFLVSSKRFDEAKAMRNMANIRERQEIEMKKEQYYKALLKEREKLIEQEKQKMFVTEMTWQSSLSKMQMNANKEIAHAEKTVEHLLSLQKTLESEVEATKSQKKLPPLQLNDRFARLNTVR